MAPRLRARGRKERVDQVRNIKIALQHGRDRIGGARSLTHEADYRPSSLNTR
jgi:hypothetical protein